jgi:transposase InsO family protein
MNTVYDYFGITRQAASQACRRLEEREALTAEFIALVRDVRIEHPRMGLRKIYHMLKPLPVGRDRFEALMRNEQLAAKRFRPAWKTTIPQDEIRRTNLLDGRVLTGPHQAWVTDISYFALPGRFAYIIVIMDVYTRVILSAHASLSLDGEQNLIALKHALRITVEERGRIITIHHSDRGTQYIYKAYLDALRKARMRISMCAAPQQNAYVERVFGTLKHEYLYHLSITSLETLRRELARTVKLYNEKRPHSSLPDALPPRAYYEMVQALPARERPKLRIHPYAPEKRVNG